ncbi:MAG: hypothetical protein HIU91_07935 [Acidobacteria bacterium]|nr:hypothetical protein [Acidobacteriota bacterium]
MSTDETTEDAFGFGAVSATAKDKLKQIRPSAVPENPFDIAKIDAVAEIAGFVSREVSTPTPYSYRSAKAARPEPRIPLNMRVPVSLGNAFQRFCEENRYSYPEALAEIMKRADLPTV